MAQKNIEWHQVVEDGTPMVDPDGDYTSRLQKIRAMYYEHANNIVQNNTDQDGVLKADCHDIVAWYREQGDRIGLLMPEVKNEGNGQSTEPNSETNKDADPKYGVNYSSRPNETNLGEVTAEEPSA
jgi:hypothetical protein